MVTTTRTARLRTACRAIATTGILVASLATSLALSCASAPQRKPLEMEPIGTVPNVRRTAVEDPGDSGVTTPNSGTPSPLKESACSGGDFDALDETLKQCEVPMPKTSDLPTGLKDKLEVKVTTSTGLTTPGGRIDVTLSLRNKSNEPLALYFSGDPAPRFEVEVIDSKGRRVDAPSGKPPPWPKGSSPPARVASASRVTLEKGGSARVRLAWDAIKTKWAPDKVKTWEGRGYPRVSAGPLAAGKYNLRVVVPLIGAYEKGDLEVSKVPIEVGT